MISYVAYCRPYKDKFMNYCDIFNEYTVVLTTYHLFTFTSWVPDEDTRFTMGKSMIYVIIANVAFNFKILIFAEVKYIMATYKLWRLKVNHKAAIKRAEAERIRREKYN